MKTMLLAWVLVLLVANGCAWLRPPTQESAAFRKTGLRPGEGEGGPLQDVWGNPVSSDRVPQGTHVPAGFWQRQ